MKTIVCLAGVLCAIASGRAQTPEQLRSWLPPVPGWTIAGEPEVFGPDNLFDRINGAAPLFIENNFREMTSLEYKKDGDYITIQAYRHATPEDAFSMYASERSSGLPFLPIGAEAQGDDKNLYFFAGNIYVKMWSGGTANTGEELQRIGKWLAGKIDPQAGYPPIVRAFPAGGKLAHTEAYTTSSYIGHEFLNRVYTANYQTGEVLFQAFVIDAGNTASARELLAKYFTFTKQPQEFSEGMLVVRDRYNGDLPVLWQGRYVTGLFVESGKPVPDAERFLRGLMADLPKP